MNNKLEALMRLSDENGVIGALAIDQRGSLKKMISSERSQDIGDSGIIDFKKVVSRELTPYASSILLDPVYCLPAAEVRAKNAGLLLAYEKTGYDSTVPGRLPDLLDVWSVKRLKEAGADAVKFLLYYDICLLYTSVSLPRLTESPYLYAQKAVEEGLLGQLTTIRCRMAHNGAVAPEGKTQGWLPARFFDEEQCGGGAFIDLGAHPIYLTNRLMGPVQAVHARLQQTNNHGVDDNAVVLIEYKSGALGVLETGFLSYGSPFQLELYGTEGALLIEDQQIRLRSSRLGHQNWESPAEAVQPIAMPMDQWVEEIVSGKAPSLTKEDFINLTKVNEAAALSNKENRRIELTEIQE